jgi:hypothetical protein
MWLKALLSGITLLMIGLLIKVLLVPRSEMFAQYLPFLGSEKGWRARFVGMWIVAIIMGIIAIIVGFVDLFS